jgi:recombination protein RecR
VPAIDDLIGELGKLPGIGRKTATRLTYFLLKQPNDHADRLARAVKAVAEKVRPCAVCGNLTEASPCSICDDPRRDSGVVCVVEEASDIGAIERTGEYDGLYHVLGGHLSPLDGIGPDELSIESLRSRLANGSNVREVILATNPSMEGEVTATYVRRMLDETNLRVTRIALGLPVGGDLEYADGVTIAQALVARREMRL